MNRVYYLAISLALLGCETEAPAPMSAPDSAGASLQPVENRGEALSAGPGAAFDLADLLMDSNFCYYTRTNGTIAPLMGTSGTQICEQNEANPVFVEPAAG